MKTDEQLANRIEAAIKNIRINNSSYISVRQEVLSDTLSPELIRTIAKTAAIAVSDDAQTP